MRLNNIIIISFLVASFLLFSGLSSAEAQNTDSEIQILKEEIKKLNQRVEELENQRAEEKRMVKEVIRDQEEAQEQVSSSIGSYVDQRIQKFSFFNTTNALLTGYGAVGFSKEDGDASTFSAVFAPIFHYRISKILHVIIEPEFELEDDELEIGLEIGQVDLFIGDYMTLSAGKILLPFNVFSQRFHPTWINKMPGVPLIYGQGEQGIVPVLSDIGVGISGGVALNVFEGSKINYAFYLVNGPRIKSEEEHDETITTSNEDNVLEESVNGGGQTDLIFGNNFTDINSNKAFGGRIGFLPVWNWEIGGSLMFGDAEDDINFFMYGFDTEFQYRGLVVLGEFIHLQNDNVGGGETEKTGYYAQGSYRLSDISIQNRYIGRFINGLEPVFRYGKSYLPGRDQEQYAIGLDWWLLSSVPFKIAYEFNDGLPDRFLVQWAFGF
jgi:hypothetical protein